MRTLPALVLLLGGEGMGFVGILVASSIVADVVNPVDICVEVDSEDDGNASIICRAVIEEEPDMLVKDLSCVRNKRKRP